MIQTILLPPFSWSYKSTPLSLWRFGCPDPAGGSKILQLVIHQHSVHPRRHEPTSTQLWELKSLTKTKHSISKCNNKSCHMWNIWQSLNYLQFLRGCLLWYQQVTWLCEISKVERFSSYALPPVTVQWTECFGSIMNHSQALRTVHISWFMTLSN
jgi:hypothetical protein